MPYKPIPKKSFLYHQEMETSATDIIAKTTWVTKIRLSNTTAGALTVSIKDKAVTANDKYKDISIAAKSASSEIFPEGREEKFTGGINVQASGAGIDATIEGYQAP